MSSWNLLKTRNSARRRKQLALQTPAQMEALEPRLLLSGINHGPSGHHAVMNLVSLDAVTHQAIQSGNWDDAETWSTGSVPESNARVHIPRGVNVKFVGDQGANVLATLRVDGKLRFARAKDSHLVVDTMVVTHKGRLEIGTTKQPIPQKTDVRITFADTGEISTDSDPLRIGRGLIAMGSVSVVGQELSSHVELAAPARKGDKTVQLTTADHGWKRGDEIVVPGLHSVRVRDEAFKVRRVEGNTITLRGKLRWDHVPPADGLTVPIANMSRNITFASENVVDSSRRGHIMMMHTNRVHIENAAFDGLGRSEKRTPAEDAQFNEHGEIIDGTGLNERGRYAMHFHQAGTDRAKDRAITFRGNAVTDSPGWGVVNHGSYVNVDNNVVYNAVGSAFVAESGDEIGRFHNNLAIRSTGSGDGLMERTDQQDFGHLGNGFWFQGTGLEVTDNVATGSRNVGFIYFVQGVLKPDGSRTEFLTSNLEDESLDNGEKTIDPRRVPIPAFRDNTAFGVGDGFQSWFHLQPRRSPQNAEVAAAGHSVIDRLTVWNARRRAIHMPYTNGMTIRDAVLINNTNSPSREAIGRNMNTENIRFENVQIEGWARGIDVPIRGQNEVVGGYFANVRNLLVTMSQDSVQYGLEIKRDQDGASPTFAELTDEQLDGRTQRNIDFDYNRELFHNNISSVFAPNRITIETDEYDGAKQFFLNQQRPDFVPYKQGGPNVPEDFVGLTNAELQAEYGLAVGGTMVPEDAEPDSKTGVFMADPVEMPAPMVLLSDRYANDEEYTLRYSVDGKRTHESHPTDLKEGWNLLTREVEGQKRTMVVFKDTSGPRFKLRPLTPRVLNPIDRNATVYVVGQILDNSLARRTYKRAHDLSQYKLRTTDDDRDYVNVAFNIYDRSQNTRRVSFRIYFDSNVAPLHELYRKHLTARTIPEILFDA